MQARLVGVPGRYGRIHRPSGGRSAEVRRHRRDAADRGAELGSVTVAPSAGLARVVIGCGGLVLNQPLTEDRGGPAGKPMLPGPPEAPPTMLMPPRPVVPPLPVPVEPAAPAELPPAPVFCPLMEPPQAARANAPNSRGANAQKGANQVPTAGAFVSYRDERPGLFTIPRVAATATITHCARQMSGASVVTECGTKSAVSSRRTSTSPRDRSSLTTARCSTTASSTRPACWS